MNLSVEDVLSRSFALKKLYSLLRRSLLRPKSPDSDFFDEEAQMLLKDLLDYAAAGIVEALRKIIAAKEHGRNPAVPARWDDTTIESPSAVLPNSLGNCRSDRDFSFRVKKDGLHRPNTISRNLTSGPFSIGTSSGERGPRKRICRVCSRKKQPVQDTNPSLLANQLFGQISRTQQKVDFLGADAEGERYWETERGPDACTVAPPSSRKRPTDFGFTTVARPLDERSDIAKEVSRRISVIEAGILALQLSSTEAKPSENTYRQRNGIGGTIGAEEWKRPVQSGRFSAKDVNHWERIPVSIDSKEAMMASPESTSQSASVDARVSSSGTGLMIHGSRAQSSHADGYKTSRSISRTQITSKEPLSAATRKQKSRSRISSYSVSHANEPEGESDLSCHRYKSFKRIPAPSRGQTNDRTSRIYESGSEDRGSGKRRSSPWESEVSGSRFSSRYFPSSRSSGRGSGTFSESHSSPSGREYSADSESSTRSYEKSSSYTSSPPSHRGHMNPRRIQDRRRELEMRIQANHEKAVGRLRRLKNKLGLIFHHHHYHHHHHHNHPEQDTIRKPSQNVFRRNDGGEIVKRSRKANGLVRSRNDQAGHFRSLLYGLLRHLRRSKKYGTMMSEGNNILRNRGAKKLSWWQTLRRRRRGGTKLPSRGRARLKLDGRRPLIKAPRDN